ncbi:MAG: DNA polymerase/3'-5' exonuclease PolX [Gemmatimonadetes bacterium]|nr:DNA polymerase/3'-5' exonuclease PolX [Gemmatimonadota bacterium]
MTAREVAEVLAEIAMLGELNGENPFRSRAFASAARALEGSDADLNTLAREGRLTSLPGVGAGLAETIRELVETGRSTAHEEMRAAIPIGLYDVLRIPGLGAKRVRLLHAGLGVDSLDSLETAVRAGRVAELSGFGAKTEAKILEGIAFVREALRRRRYPEAHAVAERLLAWLRARPEVLSAEVAGELRRRMEVVDSIDLVVCTLDTQAVTAAFRDLHGSGEADAEREGCSTIRLPDGILAHLYCVPPEEAPAVLLWQTGSEAHLSALAARAATHGLTLSPAGLLRNGQGVVPVETEDELYEALGLVWIPPELREGMGEVAAAADPLPELIRVEDLRGTFHCHTTYSDGRASVAEMAGAARARGWRYLGLADHSRSASYAGGLPEALVRQQQAEIDAWNAEQGGEEFRIFKGIESDILPDGSLDYPDAVLATFDYIVGSVHSGFGMSEAEMTARIVAAIRNPRLTMLGHPTGRILLTRGGYPVDIHAILDAAAEYGVVVEINANPHRLDLDWRHLRYAVERGVLIAINPDAHSVGGLDDVSFGIGAARKGGLVARQVLNTWTREEVEGYFAGRKA